MVPFAKAMCPEVDLREGRILVNPPEGLLDLVSRKPMGKVRGVACRCLWTRCVAGRCLWMHCQTDLQGLLILKC